MSTKTPDCQLGWAVLAGYAKMEFSLYEVKISQTIKAQSAIPPLCPSLVICNKTKSPIDRKKFKPKVSYLSILFNALWNSLCAATVYRVKSQS